MLATLNKIYENVTKDRDGRDVVNARFFWDGQNRYVKVLAKKHKVDDIVEVHLLEGFNEEEKRGWKIWVCNE